MPVIDVNCEILFAYLGRKFTEEQFVNLCFEFGIELEETTTNELIERKEKEKLTKEQIEAIIKAAKPDELLFKVDIPANRYDLLSLEGLGQALKAFLDGSSKIEYKLTHPTHHQKMIVKPEVGAIRPHVVCAILRNIKFTKESEQSFIKLQEKLHANVCRKRSLVSIGTHNLDSIEGPFTYEALPPEKIEFVALEQTKSMNGRQLFEQIHKAPVGEKHSLSHLKTYLHLIENAPAWPVIYDAKRRVLSLPPIVNSDHSKITTATKNVFIEVTATDLTKAHIVLNTLVCSFSMYCEHPFTVEAVDVQLADGQAVKTPNLHQREMKINMDEMKRGIGIPNEQNSHLLQLLQKMGIRGHLNSDHTATVFVPPNRSDILHPCDVMEDIAIAFGFNKIPRTLPRSVTYGKPVPLNQLTEQLRIELAASGYLELLNWGLCSRKENFDDLQRKDDGSAVVLQKEGNTSEFEICRTNLLSGVLRTIFTNKGGNSLKRLFEIGDVVLKDPKSDTGAVNQRRLVAVYSAPNTAGFDHVSGLLNHLMQQLSVPKSQYSLKYSSDPAFISGGAADVFLKTPQGDLLIGVLGIVHPLVLKEFGLQYPVSALEITLNQFV